MSTTGLVGDAGIIVCLAGGRLFDHLKKMIPVSETSNQHLQFLFFLSKSPESEIRIHFELFFLFTTLLRTQLPGRRRASSHTSRSKIIYRNVRSEHLLLIITLAPGHFCGHSSFHQVCELDYFLPGKCANLPKQQQSKVYKHSQEIKIEKASVFSKVVVD